MQPSQRRRAVRYAVRVPADLSVGRRSCKAEIFDAGFGGVFVCTELAPATRQLVQLQVQPPSSDKKLSFHGMVVHVVAEGNAHGHARGVGIQFYAVDPQTRAVWDQYIRSVERSGGAPREVPGLPERMPSSLRRKFLRHAAVLKVAAPDLESLRAIHARDLPSGRMFVACNDALSPGNVVFVHITHPNHVATFLLEGVVEALSSDRSRPGVHLKFLDFDPCRVQAFLEFVDSGLDTETDACAETPTVELGVSELLDSEIEEYASLLGEE